MPRLDFLRQDVRYALRGLARAPAFTITVILTLGLGIGANAAMFGIVDRLMLRPFPYLRDPDAVHRVYTQRTYRDRRYTGSVSQYTTFLDLRKWTSRFDQYAGFTSRRLAVGSGVDAVERNVAIVSASFFPFFDARPVLGRFFVAAEDTTPVGASVAVISYDFWQSQYGGRDVIGEPLQVWNLRTTIIGVAPRGFVGVFDDRPPAVYIPITTYAGNSPGARDRVEYYTRYNWGWMDMMVRRKPGVTVEAADADLTQAMLRSWDAMSAQEPGNTPAAIARPVALVGSLKEAGGPDPSVETRTVRWVSAIALIVLLIACSNVANLFLARALRRRRETAIRIALGGGRARLMVQWFTEAVALALIGCGAGVLIAQWGGAALRRLFVSAGGAPIPVVTDWRTLVAAVALALIAAILTGTVPAIVASRGSIGGDLKTGVREGGHQRSTLRTGLLVLQMALSVALLVGAGLFVRSFVNVRGLRLGYDYDRALLVSRNMRGQQVPDSDLVALQRRMLEAAQRFPGVEAAAIVSSVPFWSTSSTYLGVAGIDTVRKLGQFTYQTASPDYFATMGTRIVRGRAFDATDRAGSQRVAVVSESMARALWPGRNPIGQLMRVGSDTAAFTTVVGVAEDAAQNDLSGDDKRFRYYLPLDQYQPARGNYLVARVRGDPAAAQESIRRAIQPVMPGESYVTVRPLEELISSEQRAWRFGATMFVAFGGLALVVAAVGLYGVMAYSVAQRTHELGVRVALGAQSRDVVRLVLRQGLGVSLAGVSIGVLIALALAPQIQPLLFQEEARDPVVISIVAAALVLVALAASAGPARRAAGADPNIALRAD